MSFNVTELQKLTAQLEELGFKCNEGKSPADALSAYAKVLGADKDLTSAYSVAVVVLPPVGHTSRSQVVAAYNNFARVLRDHLIKKGTIDKEQRPKAYKCLMKNYCQDFLI